MTEQRPPSVNGCLTLLSGFVFFNSFILSCAILIQRYWVELPHERTGELEVRPMIIALISLLLFIAGFLHEVTRK